MISSVRLPSLLCRQHWGPRFLFPFWVIILIVVVIVTLIALVIISRRKKISPVSKLHLDSIKRLFTAIKGKEVSRQSLDDEKNKLVKMLSIIEKEKNEGLMTYRAYTEMKKSINEKLNKINKKISKK